jgi:MoxR-like ATPases
MSDTAPRDWRIFKGDGSVHEPELGPAPPWRRFDDGQEKRNVDFAIKKLQADLVSAALHLRRPLLIEGKPGVGKSTLIHAVARELQLGQVLVWPINTRTTLESGLYRYDAIGRLQDANLRSAMGNREPETAADIGRYVRLGPLGTAFLPADRPRALLIDEIDKSDIDLPNDLLHIFEEGEFEIPVLSRVADTYGKVPVRTHDRGVTVEIIEGWVRAREFPFIVMTSNGERDFPPPFLRRCIRLVLEEPGEDDLAKIINGYLPGKAAEATDLIREFLRQAQGNVLATDQLLNAVFLATSLYIDLQAPTLQALRDKLFQSLRA